MLAANKKWITSLLLIVHSFRNSQMTIACRLPSGVLRDKNRFSTFVGIREEYVLY